MPTGLWTVMSLLPPPSVPANYKRFVFFVCEWGEKNNKTKLKIRKQPHFSEKIYAFFVCLSKRTKPSGWRLTSLTLMATASSRWTRCGRCWASRHRRTTLKSCWRSVIRFVKHFWKKKIFFVANVMLILFFPFPPFRTAMAKSTSTNSGNLWRSDKQMGFYYISFFFWYFIVVFFFAWFALLVLLYPKKGDAWKKNNFLFHVFQFRRQIKFPFSSLSLSLPLSTHRLYCTPCSILFSKLEIFFFFLFLDACVAFIRAQTRRGKKVRK